MKKIDLNTMTEDELDELRDKVQREIGTRINGPKKRVWYAEMNGGRQYYKKLKSAVDELIGYATNLTEDEDVYIRLDNSNISEKDYNLKHDSWYIG